MGGDRFETAWIAIVIGIIINIIDILLLSVLLLLLMFYCCRYCYYCCLYDGRVSAYEMVELCF